jgi:hypothetical protein
MRYISYSWLSVNFVTCASESIAYKIVITLALIRTNRVVTYGVFWTLMFIQDTFVYVYKIHADWKYTITYIKNRYAVRTCCMPSKPWNLMTQNTIQKSISIVFCISVLFVMIRHSASTVNSSHPPVTEQRHTEGRLE